MGIMTRFPSAKNKRGRGFSSALFGCAQLVLFAASINCLSACTQIGAWLQERELSEANASSNARPVGVTFDLASSTEAHKQVSMFFNGKSLARVLEPGDNWTEKTLLDYKNNLVTRKYFSTETQDVEKIDPLQYPPVLDLNIAKREKAKCLGTGRSKGYSYHRWSGTTDKGEWEVWTDDNDNFPIYYRAIKNGGEVCTWTMANSWIDGSTYNKPTFFTTEADPPPPEPEIKEEQEPEEKKIEEKKQTKRSHQIAKKMQKRSQ